MLDLRCYYSSFHKLAVTGATGYIGRNLLEAYGNENFLHADIESVRDAVVVHLAANVDSTRNAFLSNIEIDSLVIEAAKANNCSIIYASSNNVYPLALGCRTSELLRCNDYYAASKVAGEKLLQDLAKVPYSILRVADVFGMGQKHGNLFKAIESCIIDSSDLTLIGCGTKVRSYIYIKELTSIVSHLVALMQRRQINSMTYNLCHKDTLNVREILSYVAGLTNKNIIRTRQEECAVDLDVRTMEASSIGAYNPRWASFTPALSSYVNEILHSSCEGK
jgi:nucleoside-diphosphate-sugar epimerase